MISINTNLPLTDEQTSVVIEELLKGNNVFGTYARHFESDPNSERLSRFYTQIRKITGREPAIKISKNWKAWNSEEDEILKKGVNDGLTLVEIQEKLPERSLSSVKNRYHLKFSRRKDIKTDLFPWVTEPVLRVTSFSETLEGLASPTKGPILQVKRDQHSKAPSLLLCLFVKLGEDRQHTILGIQVKSKKETVLNLLCNRCRTTFIINGHNYCRAGGKETEKNFILSEAQHFFPYCCPTCLKIYRQKNIIRPVGNQHSQWKGGMDPKKREGFIPYEYKKWRQGVFIFYKGVCFLTGLAVRENLEAHHLESWSTSIDLRYQVSNGVLIDKKIHTRFHSVFGDKTTKKTFEQFCKKEYGLIHFPWETSDDSMSEIQSQINTQREIFHKGAIDLFEKSGYRFETGTYENKKSLYTIFCPKHKISHEIKLSNFKRYSFLPCCAKELPNNNLPPNQTGLKRSAESIALKIKSGQKRCQKVIEDLTLERSHEIKSGFFVDGKSSFNIYCTRHKKEQTILYSNYRRSKCGLDCCFSRAKKEHNTALALQPEGETFLSD